MIATLDYVGEHRLEAQRNRLRRILGLQNRISQIDQKLSGPGGMKYSDMPRNQNPFDCLAFLVQEKMEKEKELDKIMPKFNSENQVIVRALLNMSSLTQPNKGPLISTYVDLLRYYYLENKSWDEILKIFNFENSDSKKRLLYGWHDKALKLLKKSQKSA